MTSVGFAEHVSLFTENDVVGEELLELGMSDLAKLGVRGILVRKQLFCKIQLLAEQSEEAFQP